MYHNEQVYDMHTLPNPTNGPIINATTLMLFCICQQQMLMSPAAGNLCNYEKGKSHLHTVSFSQA